MYRAFKAGSVDSKGGLNKNNNRASDDVEPKARLSVTTERYSLDP